MHYLRFIIKLLATNFKASIALRGAFVMQMIFMMINNLIFFMVWWILFQRFDDINGWGNKDVQALYGIGAGSFGVAVVFGGGVRFLAEKIISGELDSYLVWPKDPLVHMTFTKSWPSGWGDLLSAAILFYWSGYLSLENLPLILSFIFVGACIFVAMIVIANSLTFFLGNLEGFQAQIYEFLILFSTYPEGLFDGLIKIFLFSVIPAGFISYLPMDVLRNFSWGTYLICLGSGVFYLLLAFFIFHRGLKRYESGNLMISGSS